MSYLDVSPKSSWIINAYVLKFSLHGPQNSTLTWTPTIFKGAEDPRFWKQYISGDLLLGSEFIKPSILIMIFVLMVGTEV